MEQLSIKAMSKFDSITEKIFRERVKVDTSDLKYVEMGSDFVRFRDENGKLFEVSVKEKKSKNKLKEL